MIDFRDGKVFVVVGATTGQVIASQVGGIGVVGGFGGMALGTPVIVVGGAIAGAAVKAIIDGIETGDVKVLGATTLGSVLGAGFSATVGNVGVGVAGSAFGVGLGTIAVTGGVFALGVYQLIKMFAKGQSKESAAQIFERIGEMISGQELYNQAMMELDPILGEIAWKQKMSYLEISCYEFKLHNDFAERFVTRGLSPLAICVLDSEQLRRRITRIESNYSG